MSNNGPKPLKTAQKAIILHTLGIQVLTAERECCHLIRPRGRSLHRPSGGPGRRGVSAHLRVGQLSESWSQAMCIYKYMHKYIYIYMYACVYIYIYGERKKETYAIYIYIYMNICMLYIYVCAHVSIYAHLYLRFRFVFNVSGLAFQKFCVDLRINI